MSVGNLNSGIGTTTTMSDKTRRILNDNPNVTTFKEFDHLFRRRYNQASSTSTFYNILRELKAKEAEETEEAAVETETVTVATEQSGATAKPPKDNLLVPQLLLKSAKPIKQVVYEAGGIEIARRLSEMIDLAGGTDNFRSVLSLLKEVEETPSSPRSSMPTAEQIFNR